jgi:hypothetical protein
MTKKKDLRDDIYDLMVQVETMKRYYERELRLRRKEERRAAAANVENARLREQVKNLDWSNRLLKLQFDGDDYHARKLQVAQDRISLIQDIVTAPLD